MRFKKKLFQKKINGEGLLQKEVNDFHVCVKCGNCGRCDSLVAECCNPKEFGWTYIAKINDTKIIPSGAWFCSKNCLKKQAKRWERAKKRRNSQK